MMNFNAEMIAKAKSVNSAEELIALAKENGIDMTEDEAKTYFAQLNPKSGELDDDDLDSVAGGACGDSNNGPDVNRGDMVRITSGETCSKCGTNIGTVAQGKATKYIKCKPCSQKICNIYNCTYELIN